MHAIGRDERVMACVGILLTFEAATKLVAGQIANQAMFGHCFWPIERRSDNQMLGYCGLQLGPVETPLEDRIEIGWLLKYDAWGRGYATEAASAALRWAWAKLSVDAVWAITTPGNMRSRKLMRRLGIERRPDLDFEHPALGTGDPLRPHITHMIGRPQFA